MDSSNLFFALLNTTAFLLCVLFTAYAFGVVRPFLRHEDVDLGDRGDFEWHFLVPSLNEETVVVATIEHLVESFPECRVWCIDDASADRTLAILGFLAKQYPNVEVISRQFPNAQQGKGEALNAGYRAISAHVGDADRERVIVGVIDADGRLDSNCPDVIASEGFFGDPEVGAVQVQVRITQDVDGMVAEDVDRLVGDAPRSGGDPLLVRLQDLEFAGPIAAMQMLRSKTGSVAMGGNGQFTRLSSLDRIAAVHATPWHGALLEDFELGLHVLLGGERTAYCHDTFVAQTGIETVSPLIRQRTRWAQGNMQCLRYLWQVLNSPNIALSGALEISYYMYIPFSQILGSVVFPLTALVYAWYALSDPSGVDAWVTTGAWGLLPLGFVFGIAPHAIWGLFYRSHCSTYVTRREAFKMAIANVAYGYLLQASAWKALHRVIRGQRGWDKTARPSDRPVADEAAPVAAAAAGAAAAGAGAAAGAASQPELPLTPTNADDLVSV